MARYELRRDGQCSQNWAQSLGEPASLPRASRGLSLAKRQITCSVRAVEAFSARAAREEIQMRDDREGMGVPLLDPGKK